MSNDIRVIKLQSVNLPVIRQANFATHWVPYGEDNAFPDRINDYESYSATHKPILRLKANMIAGGGLICDEKKNPGLAKAIKKLNDKERSYKTLKKIGRDYAKFNGFAIEVIWNRAGTHIAGLHWLDFSRVRAGVPDVNTGEVANYYYSKNWKMQAHAQFRPRPIPVFNPAAVLGTHKGEPVLQQPRQIVYFYEPENGIDFYPVPTYNAAFKDIEYEYQQAMFKNNTMKNGMFQSSNIHYNWNPTKDEKDAIYKGLEANCKGTENAGGFMVTFGVTDSGQKPVDITPLSLNTNADLYSGWDASAEQKIVSAHQLSSRVLAGLPGDGGLGGNGAELLQAFNNFQETYVNDKQSDIVDVLKELLMHSPGVTSTDDLDIATKHPFVEIPDWALEVADDATLKKWAKERLGLEFVEPQLPLPAANALPNPANRTQGQPPAIAKAG